MPRKRSATPNQDQPGFEESITELEAIVAAMEEESLPLEEMVTRYEQGTRLLARCEEVLKSARKRLKTIAARNDTGADTPDDSGIPLTDDVSADTDLSDDDDDIRLF